MSYPKGKVAFREHQDADRKKSIKLHILALASALIVMIIFLTVN